MGSMQKISSESGVQKLTPDAAQKAVTHLNQSCEIMARLIVEHGSYSFVDREFRPFHTLVNSIISQQISTKAADAIKLRVEDVVPSFTPAGFLSLSTEELRAAGLSSRKTRYIHELAQRVSDEKIDLEALQDMPDAEVIAELVELPGVGKWTAEMFLIFALNRPDVLSLGDGGLQRSAKQLLGDDVDLGRVGERWKPYRTVAAWYLWQNLVS
jgi:DNA-3-methyladenine glycosylase II